MKVGAVLAIWGITSLVAFGIASWHAGIFKMYIFGVGLLVWGIIGVGLLYAWTAPSPKAEVPE